MFGVRAPPVRRYLRFGAQYLPDRPPHVWIAPTDPPRTGRLTQSSGRRPLCGKFPDECCFQVIYFNSNISFVERHETSLAAGLETIRLRHAVKNAWVRRQTGITLGLRGHL